MRYIYARFVAFSLFVLSFLGIPFIAQAAIGKTDQVSQFVDSSESAETVTLSSSGDHVYVMAGIVVDATGDHVTSVDACGTAMTRLAITSSSVTGAYLYIYGAPLPSSGSCTVTVNFDTTGLQASIHASSFSGAQATASTEGVGEAHVNSTSSLAVAATSVSSNTVLFGISRDQNGEESGGTNTDLSTNPQAGFTSWSSSTPNESAGSHELIMQSSGATQYDGLVAVVSEYAP